jgi:hypothetical protein
MIGNQQNRAMYAATPLLAAPSVQQADMDEEIHTGDIATSSTVASESDKWGESKVESSRLPGVNLDSSEFRSLQVTLTP